MISFVEKVLLLLSGILSLVGVFVNSMPLETAKRNLSDTALKFVSNAKVMATAPPHFVIYSDSWVSGETGPPPAAMVQGFNVFAMSFLLISGAADQAEAWTQLSATQRSAVKAQYETAGIQLIVSLFGSTDAPTSSGADPVAMANTMAAWVLKYDLDGVDVDYEDFDAINAGNGDAEAWLATFTKQLRTKLPQGSYILTHAPVAPWFSPGKFGGGAYLTVDSTVGSLIDWYNVQFYNQGTTEYTTCSGLLDESSSTWAKSALFQIAANGIPLSKLVIGKPALVSDASNGFMSTSMLASCLVQATSQGWNAGVMVWEFPDANAAWIEAVTSQAFPSSPSTITTTTTISSSTMSSPLSSTSATSSSISTSSSTATISASTSMISTSTFTSFSASMISTSTSTIFSIPIISASTFTTSSSTMISSSTITMSTPTTISASTTSYSIPVISASTFTSSATPTSTGIINCLEDWSDAVAYEGGSNVVYNDHLWTANWWSEADAPGGVSGDWTDDGPLS